MNISAFLNTSALSSGTTHPLIIRYYGLPDSKATYTCMYPGRVVSKITLCFLVKIAYGCVYRDLRSIV